MLVDIRRADGKREVVELEPTAVPAAIGAADVLFWDLRDGRTMVSDKFAPDKRLPLNRDATAIYRAVPGRSPDIFRSVSEMFGDVAIIRNDGK